MTDCDRQQRYLDLVNQRKQCLACHDLVNPAIHAGGVYDSSQIGPWSRYQGNLQAKLMVVGQNWGNTKYFQEGRGLDDPRNPLNTHLTELLASIGAGIEHFAVADRKGGVFFTNAALCLRQDDMQGTVDSGWYENCAKRFLKPLIEIVKPSILVALGEGPYNAILQAYGIPYEKPKRYWMEVERVGQAGGNKELPGMLLFPVYSCGSQGVNCNRRLSAQMNDWKPIGQALRALATS